MAYSKQTWDTTSFFNPTRMNHMEQGIYDASKALDDTNISYSASSTRFYIVCPMGINNFEAVIPFVKKPSSVSVSNLKIFAGGSWVTATNVQALIIDNGIEIACDAPNWAQNGVIYWAQATITATY